MFCTRVAALILTACVYVFNTENINTECVRQTHESLNTETEECTRTTESDHAQHTGIDHHAGNEKQGVCQRTTNYKDDNCKVEKDIVIMENEFKEYSKLTRIEAKKVGEVVEIELEPGKVHKRLTTALDPTLFEIPDFLSSDECDQLIAAAKAAGMDASQVFGKDLKEEIKNNKDLSELVRVSQTAWLRPDHTGKALWLKLRSRLASLTQLPYPAIMRSEMIQVASYGIGGHYHGHVDSQDNPRLPCCFQTDCQALESTPRWNECCRKCRYATVIVYLNDVEEGGETAFPFTDVDDSLVKKTLEEEMGNEWFNLSKNCHKSSVRITPEKGKAILWYNHDIDKKGYLGKVYVKSLHGGCDVIKGSKWIGNFWINWPTYEARSDESRMLFNL